MRLAFQNAAHHLGRSWSHGFAAVDSSRGRPFQMRLMALGAVLVNGGGPIGNIAAHVRGNTYSAMKDLHRSGREARFQLLAGELIRHAVQVPLDLDVIVDVGPDSFPLRELVALAR